MTPLLSREVDHWAPPASVLTDIGAIFTATPRRGGRTALQVLLGELGIAYINSRVRRGRIDQAGVN